MAKTPQGLLGPSRVSKPFVLGPLSKLDFEQVNVVEGGKAKMPMWLRGKLNHNFCFGSFEELEAYLDALHKGVVEPDYTRWVFFDKV